ncbi:MAG: hypothetical protein ACP5I3_10655 [Thermoproteus sp.]|uniref:Uncharacterized protein n=1 Tax=Thermoproteus uzoniensis (strain 768-20) TaxID=999630 RepID=F2L3J9_THEU7|nr:hypothetical protein [Thermoproteus uzoniensis]AEA13238.1 hypothetical protein TUZN_1777 [Thermoproteus uzoniensis 768-20]
MRLPPRIKVLEALSAIADGRIKLLGDKEAEVVSSDGSRTYKVYVDLGRRAAYSDDNGTIYRGYVGYPIISFLMARGVLPVDERLGQALKGIPWRKLNEQYKKYDAVMELVKAQLKERGIPGEEVDRYIDLVMAHLRKLGLRLEKPAERH